MKPKICPKCRGKLEQVGWAGVEVDRCLSCKGIWFDSLEAEQLKAIKGSEILDVGDPETGSQLDRITENVKCPCCKVKMTRMVDIDQHCIWYETCPKCRGVWLDAGEFKNFKNNFKRQEGLLDRAMSVFGRKKP